MLSESMLKKDQVYHQLQEAIATNKLVTGSKLPAEADLCTKLGVSRITLRASLNRLQKEGLIKRVRGSGTFVASKTETPASNGTIMVVHAIDSGFESSWHYIVPEINRFALKENLKTFTMTNIAFELFSDNDIKTFVEKKHIIGIIATINHFKGHEPIITKLQTAGVPVVLAHARPNDHTVTGFASVAVDEKAGWKAAIKHLTQCGHSNIAIIGHSCDNGFRDNNKAETLEQLTACGANPNSALICQTDFDKPTINHAVKALLNSSPAPTAFLCYSDFYAVYVYEALANLGLRIPADIAVMGICGFPDARLLSPPLSTIDYGYSETAKLAVKMLVAPKQWFNPKTGKGKLRMKPFALKARKSSKQQPKEVTINRVYHAPQVENVTFA
jgi:GntR family transcriptional regulator, arabinose operon transcriptional repressor